MGSVCGVVSACGIFFWRSTASTMAWTCLVAAIVVYMALAVHAGSIMPAAGRTFVSHLPDDLRRVALDHIDAAAEISEKWYGGQRLKLFGRDFGDKDECPEHPYPYAPLPSPLPSILQDTFDDLEQLYEDLGSHPVLPPPQGSMTAVVYGDDIVFEMSKGSVNATQTPPGPPPDLDTMFRIGSVSKVFPCIEMMQLFEKRVLLSLDDPVAAYIPEFSIKNQFSNTSQITWRSMMSHMAGETCIEGFNCAPGAKDQCKVTTKWTLQATANEHVVLPLYARPSYSNLGFGLLGRLPEMLAKRWNIADVPSPFEDYVRINITDPLGMKSTTFNITDDVAERMAQGSSLGGATVDPRSNRVGGWENPSGGCVVLNDSAMAISSVRDLATLVQQFVMSHDMKIAFRDWDGKTAMSYPWESFFIDSYFVRCKAGNQNGYSGFICFNPSLKLGVVTLFNTNLNTLTYIVPTLELLVPAFRKYLSSLPIRPPLPPRPGDFAGRYVAYPGDSDSPVIVIGVETDPVSGEDAMVYSYVQELPAIRSVLAYIGGNAFQSIAPNDSPSRFIGSCIETETGAYQYLVVQFSEDLAYFTMPGNGGTYRRM